MGLVGVFIFRRRNREWRGRFVKRLGIEIGGNEYMIIFCGISLSVIGFVNIFVRFVFLLFFFFDGKMRLFLSFMGGNRLSIRVIFCSLEFYFSG